MIRSLAMYTNSDAEKFYTELTDVIKEKNGDREDVEVQYQMTTRIDGVVVHSALVVGREVD